MPVISERNAEGSDSDQIGDKRPVTFADQVPASSTQKITYDVPKDATIEHAQVRIYQGAELDLQLQIYIDQGEDEGSTDVIRTVGKDYIDGDDDDYPFDLSMPIERGDTLVLEATNNDGSNAYDYRVNMEFERAGGAMRPLAMLKEVFM